MTPEQQIKEEERLLALIAKLAAQRDQARRLAEQFRDDSERPGGGHTRLPWERKNK